MALSNDARQQLDGLAWIAWGKAREQLGDDVTDRDRQYFFAGFGAGRLDVLTTPLECDDCGSELSILCPKCDKGATA